METKDPKTLKMDMKDLKTLKICPSDNWEAGIRGWTHPEEPTNAEAWGVYFIAPWKLNAPDKDKQEQIEKLKEENGRAFKAYFEADTYMMFGDKTATFSKQGLVEFRDAIDECIKMWDSFDEEIDERAKKSDRPRS
jgi:hypothetical protein